MSESIKDLQANLWITVETLEERAKRFYGSTPALPMDGNWITTELGTFNAQKNTAEFIRAFKRQSKGAKFIPYFAKLNYPFEYVFVYYEGETFPRGIIGYGTWGSVKGEGRERYTIASRRIANNKFTNDKPQHLMVATEKLDIAISNANTYLLQHNPLEIAKYFKDDMYNYQGDLIDKADSNLRVARIESLFGKNGFNRLAVEELVRITDMLMTETLPALDMYAQGRADRDDRDVRFHNALKKVAERKKERADEANRCKVTWCVYVQVKERGPIYRAVRIPHVYLDEGWRLPPNSWKDGDVIHSTWTAEREVPAWLLGKMAVTDTLHTNQYVPNVGYKVATNVFYIEELESDRAS
jgi:hypothetical protein